VKSGTKILLGVGIALTGTLLIMGGFVYFCCRDFLEVMGPSKPTPLGVVGNPMDPLTQERYDFATGASGLSFPAGTVVDIFDEGNFVVGCMALPAGTLDDFLRSSRAQLQALTGSPWVRGLQHLRQENQTIPDSGMELGLLPYSPGKTGVQLFIHRPTGKCWLVIHCYDWTGQPAPPGVQESNK